MKTYKIFAINLGSTSTKISYYEDDQCVIDSNIAHPSDHIKACTSVNDQYGFRKEAILDFMKEHQINLDDLDAVTSRGGMTEPIVSGVYRINKKMLEQTNSGLFGVHVCAVGCQIAFDIASESDHAIPLTVDTPSTDEFEPIARYSGLKEIERVSSFQALNHKAMARHYADRIGRRYEDLNLIVVMLGGGISIVPHRKGQMIDGPHALEGEGPFSNNRCCTVPPGPLVRLCYSGQYSEEQMMRKINGEAGLMAYLGTFDILDIIQRIESGDRKSAEVMEAMCYQTAKEIGAYAAVLKGEVDAILLTGGMANSDYLCNLITKRVSFIAPVEILPGQREMESLCLNSYEALTGKCEIKTFNGQNTQVSQF